MLEGLKEAFQSGKEQAIMNSVMSMFGAQIKAIQPQNSIAQFIDDKMKAVFMPDEGHEAFGAMAELVNKLLVEEANQNPNHSLIKLMTLYEDFRIWYKEYANADKNK